MERTMTIEEFRKKYGANAPSLEEKFALLICANLNELRGNQETGRKEFFTTFDEDVFFQFVDYVSAVGKYDEMYFAYTSYAKYYAYSLQGRCDIIQQLNTRAAELRLKAEQLDAIAKEMTNSNFVG